MPSRAVVAALSLAKPESARYRLPELADALANTQSDDNNKSLPPDFYLTRSELQFAWGGRPDTTDKLLSTAFESVTDRSNSRISKVYIEELLAFYRRFNNGTSGDGVTLGVLAESQKVSVADLIGEIITGKLKAIGALSWRLTDIVIDKEAPVIAPPKGYVTLAEASHILRVHTEYLSLIHI